MSDNDGPTHGNDPSAIRRGGVVGRWTLETYIAEGGFGAVWEGRDRDGRSAAIKFLLHPGGRARFLQEHALASLQDGQWTPRVLDADLDAPTPWIAFEHLRDRTLLDQAPLAESQLRSFAMNLFLAVSSLHLAGISHRDLTPRNVFYRDGDVKLIDFGLAKRTADAPGLTQSALGGTPGFAAPEQFEEDVPVGAAADLWAWGSVAYFAATGAQIYSGSDASHPSLFAYMDTIRRHDPSELTDVPAWLQSALVSALQLEPGDRSRDAVARALPASDKDRQFLNMALELIALQGVAVQDHEVSASADVPATVITPPSQELLELRQRVRDLEQAQDGDAAPTTRGKSRVVAAVVGVVAIAVLTFVGIGVVGRDAPDDAEQPDSSNPTAETDDSANEPPAEPEPDATPEVGGETNGAAASTVNSVRAGPDGTVEPLLMSELAGAPDTVDRAVVAGTDRPGAMSIHLDQAGCAAASTEYRLDLPDGDWELGGNIALSDATPSDANVSIAVGESPPQILRSDNRNVSWRVPSATGSITILAETLSAFGSQCGEMPVEVLIFDSFIR